MILLFISIVYSSAFEFGITPMDRMHMYADEFWEEVDSNKVRFYCDLETEIEIKNFFIGGGIKTFMGKSITAQYEFTSYKVTYEFNIGYKFDIGEIGFRHYCIHPVVPYITFDSPPIFGGGYEELYIRFKMKTNQSN